MTLQLDPRTLTLATGLVALVLCGYMFHFQLTRRVYPGFRHWSLGALLVTLAQPLMSLRDMLPDLLSVVLANQLLIAFITLAARGLALFGGKKPALVPDLVISVLYLVLALWWTYFDPSINKRIIIFSLTSAFYLLRCAHLVRREAAAVTGVGNRVLTGAFALTGVFFLVRALATLFVVAEPSSLMAASPLQAFTFMLSLASVPVLLIGLVFLNIQRLEHDLRASQEEVKTLSGLLPICACCKRIRDDGGYWHQVEEYITHNSSVTFTHGICPQCMERLYPDLKGKDPDRA